MVNEIRRKKKEKEKVDKESEYDLLKSCAEAEKFNPKFCMWLASILLD